ncbi:MAG: pyridoxamine 5'-phosphate oxidase family protein [Promethearchaeota archaeon]
MDESTDVEGGNATDGNANDPALLEEALTYLASHNLLTMATSGGDNVPNAANLEYANDGIDVYVTSRRVSWKVRNIEENPVAFYEVHDEVDINNLDEVKDIKGIQALCDARVLHFGTAEFEHAWAVLLSKYPVFERLRVGENRVVLHFHPRKLWFLDYSVKFGFRAEFSF